MGDFLYCTYSRLLPKPSSFLLSSLSESSLTFLFFIVCFLLQSFAMCPSLLHLKHFLVSHSFFFPQQFFAICPYLLQLKHFGFPSLKLSLDLLISISCSLLPYVVPVLVLWSWRPFVNSYPCPTDVIATFYFLRVSGIAIGGYLSIVLIISCHTFFFNKKMACSSSVLAFMASASNSMIKSAVFCLPCLNISICHSVSAALDLSLNVVLISFMKLS